MSATVERIVLSIGIGLLLTGAMFLAALVLDTLGATTLAKILLWPNELAVVVDELSAPPSGSGVGHEHRGQAAALLGFPLGTAVYSVAAYLMLSKKRKP